MHRKNLRTFKDGRAQAELSLALAAPEQPTEPQAGDNYVRIPFRALSATMVGGYGLDLSREGVLESAVDMFNDLPMYADHNVRLDNWVGKTAEARWSAANGDTPGGVDVTALVYSGSDLSGEALADQSKILVGLREGIIKHCSATIFFDWERSHPNLKGDAFWDMLGEEVDGEIVRIIVTKINKVGELSLVWLGADPYARRLAAADDAVRESETLRTRLQEAEGNLATKAEALAKLETEAATLRAGAKELAAYRETLLAELDNDAKLLGEKLIDAYRAFLAQQPLQTILGVRNDYRARLDATYPMMCALCGSTSVQRRSSVANSAAPANTAVDESQYKTGGK